MDSENRSLSEMKTTIVYGSPRKKGNTSSLLAPFMDELGKGGAKIDFLMYMRRGLPAAGSVWAARRIRSGLFV